MQKSPDLSLRDDGKGLEAQQTLTGGAVQAEALADQQVPVPEHGPQQVSRAGGQLGHLLGHFYFLPTGALWHPRVDALPEPHLPGKGGVRR